MGLGSGSRKAGRGPLRTRLHEKKYQVVFSRHYTCIFSRHLWFTLHLSVNSCIVW